MGVITQDKINLQSVKSINDKADAAQTLADSTNQHFWFTSTGTDTGAHITEVTQEEFTDPTDPNYQSGGNLLARSNGIAVRDGMTEVSSFSESQIVLGKTDEQNVVLSSETYADTGFYRGNMLFNHGTDATAAVMADHEETDDVNRLSFDVANQTSQTGASLWLYADNAAKPTNAIYFNTGNSTSRLLDDGIETNIDNRVLWAGTASQVTNSDNIPINGYISEQMTGIVLAFSRYANSTVYNDSWWYVYIPKWHVTNHNGNGIYMETPTGFNNTKCIKYIYVYDDHIVGHASNNASGTGYNNSTRVLRAILGA